ncbi:MAG: aminotransferase class I/II-fold pyridoxal phosphate-dependent enzyme [Desulfotomaculum sp.]|nr:aminotransferase class I/II-fold pyridoxal phosphate-dependent enzyme [Desulfotomaculum sp.]
MKQLNTPLLEAIKRYYAKNKLGLHVPAHRQGRAVPREMLEQELYKLDLTEVAGLDDLHNPQGAIAKAQELAAEAFGSKKCYFLVNGTSSGLIALILATCRECDQLIIPRTVHRSVLTGLILSGAQPIYIYPPVIKQFGIPSLIPLDLLQSCIDKYKKASGILMVHPSYYGIAERIGQIVNIANQYNIPLLIDEAHGGHFRFHEELPLDALSAGADAVVQSTHKVGGALTQASMLHLNSNRLDYVRLEECLRMVQSTSPSYILMASLDAARRQLVTEGKELIERSLQVARKWRDIISDLPGIKVLSPQHLPGYDILLLDETRMVVNVQEAGLTGYQAAEILSSRHGIQVEMADHTNIVVLLGLNAADDDGKILYRALSQLAFNNARFNCSLNIQVPPQAVQAMTPRQAWLSKTRTVKLEEAGGKISADSVAVYPPGIPALCPGEIISTEILDYLLDVRSRKLHIQCSGDASLQNIRVIDI